MSNRENEKKNIEKFTSFSDIFKYIRRLVVFVCVLAGLGMAFGSSEGNMIGGAFVGIVPIILEILWSLGILQALFTM